MWQGEIIAIQVKYFTVDSKVFVTKKVGLDVQKYFPQAPVETETILFDRFDWPVSFYSTFTRDKLASVKFITSRSVVQTLGEERYDDDAELVEESLPNDKSIVYLRGGFTKRRELTTLAYLEIFIDDVPKALRPH